ncbi:hypothetical protein GC207_13440 [bacterium]|nr:hypothetical protein [bacterium]
MVFSSSTDEHAIKRHHALTALIQQEADRRGKLSFARFMELALYAPNLGYYEQHRKSIGRKGDFFTSVSVGPLFGELLACQFADWLKELSSSRFAIVEAGAHNGQLAQDILSALKSDHPSTFNRVDYFVIEPSPNRRQWQAEQLGQLADKVRWFESWTDLSSFHDRSGHRLTGIVFANELLDALPVHRLRWSQMSRSWREQFVSFEGSELTFVDGDPSPEVEAYSRRIAALARSGKTTLLWPEIPDQLLDVLPDGFVTEICPSAGDWWQQAAETLNKGWLMTLDYGLSADEFFSPARTKGTLRAYRQHHVTDDILGAPGEQDLTAHVNFGAIELVGESTGMNTFWSGSQADFLTWVLSNRVKAAGWQLSRDQVRQFQTLTHPDHLGRSFRVLVQARQVNAAK